MKQIGKAVLWVLGILWGLFVFLSSNSPDDVKQTTGGWLSLPIVRSVPDTVLQFAAQPLVLAMSFLLIGGFAGWKARGIKRRPRDDGWYDLGVQLSLMASRIEELTYYDVDHDRLNADLDVLRLNVLKRGLPFPNGAEFRIFQSHIPYLTRVAALLKAGHIPEARAAAKYCIENPPTNLS